MGPGHVVVEADAARPTQRVPGVVAGRWSRFSRTRERDADQKRRTKYFAQHADWPPYVCSATTSPRATPSRDSRSDALPNSMALPRTGLSISMERKARRPVFVRETPPLCRLFSLACFNLKSSGWGVCANVGRPVARNI